MSRPFTLATRVLTIVVASLALLTTVACTDTEAQEAAQRAEVQDLERGVTEIVNGAQILTQARASLEAENAFRSANVDLWWDAAFGLSKAAQRFDRKLDGTSAESIAVARELWKSRASESIDLLLDSTLFLETDDPLFAPLSEKSGEGIVRTTGSNVRESVASIRRKLGVASTDSGS